MSESVRTHIRQCPGSSVQSGLLLAIIASLAAVTACHEGQDVVGPGDVLALRRTGPDARNSISAGPSTLGSATPLALGAIIDNGTLQLGVLNEGNLGVPGGNVSSGQSPTTIVGLRYLPTNSEATAPGCVCEGWGVADARSGVWGGADVASDGVVNLALVSFTSSGNSAASVVNVGRTFRVTHDYHPSAASPNLYEIRVTIENTSGSEVDVRYRRAMDWDIAPNTFSEFITIQGTAGAANVLFASDDGFASINPLAGPSSLYATGDFVDVGPADNGALFDFGFGVVPPGSNVGFTLFYGAAGSEEAALAALSTVGARVYSLAQANYNGSDWSPLPGVGAPAGTFGFATGQPHTFTFGFKRGGSRVTFRDHTPSPNSTIKQSIDLFGLLSVEGLTRQLLQASGERSTRLLDEIKAILLKSSIAPLEHSVTFAAESPIDYSRARVVVFDGSNTVEIPNSAILPFSSTSGRVLFGKYWFNEHVTVRVELPLVDGSRVTESWSFDVKTKYFAKTLKEAIVDALLGPLALVLDVLKALVFPLPAS